MDFDTILGRYSNRLQVWPNNHHAQDTILLSKKIIYRKNVRHIKNICHYKTKKFLFMSGS